MVRQGARVSVILAFVFPAIVCAAVALAYYGYRYAVASSVRSKASLMEGNQQLAQLLSRQGAGSHRPRRRRAVRGGRVGRPALDPPSTFELPAGVESVVVLDAALQDPRRWCPAPDRPERRRELDRWQSYVRGPGVEVAAAVDAQPRRQLPPPAPAVRGQVGADRVRGEEDRRRPTTTTSPPSWTWASSPRTGSPTRWTR